uniref:DNA ligase OB-like domain-containing protein n=1 Tax=Phytophthora ramorum TaxID=164328 RepID=H3HE25_PHYRM
MVYSCSCPAWRNQRHPPTSRTCKHLKQLLGDAFEMERARGSATAPRGTASANGSSRAVKWEREKDDPTGWWVSEKLDGVRAFWDSSKKIFLSRLGNEYPAPSWFTARFPGDVDLDGELFGGREKASSKYIEWVEHTKCKSLEHLDEVFSEIEKLGGEGLMIRRSSSLLKIKSFHDGEAEVLAHEDGKGKYVGMVGALRCRMASGKMFKVASGLSDAQRDKPPAVGSIIVYKCQELTNDGIPRFPVFVGLAADKTCAKDPVIANAVGHDANSDAGGVFFRVPCALLVEFLDLRGSINLLNASRWLRYDRVLTATALEKTRYAQHFHQKCAADWWHLTPAWKADGRLEEEPTSDIWEDCHVRTAAGKELTHWKDTVRDTPQWQHVPLLSIIDFMVSKLLPQSYISFKYAATVYTARPVIVRLHPPENSDDRREDGQDARDQDVARRINTGNVTCAVCQLYADEVDRYQTKVAEMVSEWREAVKKELPGWKEKGMHQMEIDRRTYEMREEMIPYNGFFTSNVARRHGDVIIRHICSYWTTLDHLKINTLGYNDASQLVAALTSDIRKQCQHFSKIKQAMTNAFPRVARIRYEVDEPEPPLSTNLWLEAAVTELVAGVSPSGFLCGMLFIEKSV